eukprot:XP_001709508.1 Hypothetical protein GL50803_34095 [Giardia lamblia ATCC 50803]
MTIWCSGSYPIPIKNLSYTSTHFSSANMLKATIVSHTAATCPVSPA